MSIIIGIDPGSRITGYGIIHDDGKQTRYIHSGCLRLNTEETFSRLHQIFSQLQQIISTYQPNEAAIEQVFMHKNANSALKLGQARGVAIAALGPGMSLSEYSARQVKLSVVGFGAAKKEQVQHMVQRLLNLKQPLQADEADAIAIALCHAHSRKLKLTHLLTSKKKYSSWRKFRAESIEK